MARAYQHLETEKYFQASSGQEPKKVRREKKATLGSFNFVLFGVFLVVALLIASEQVPALQEWPFLRMLF